ncbi:Phosphotyrosyl phosphatase activator [Xylona heveae TC161]|uniref:Serine/threonine-protein phosphatase 2A activator n=1 Tax=Xylona heveae (strain CBS 132557 / TC161) TaxID=1328760 RepID=A0A161TCY2_XYLHT|nr:Phosphotyrosyl phosphatase activator [Xylona heveae TC161]KZF23667.1 Phosphotyrosyl phosphatase activator [Xylona heveae TC161]
MMATAIPKPQNSSKSPSPSQISPLPQKLVSKLPKLTPRRRQTPSANPLPVPETPALPPPSSAAENQARKYIKPTRRILSHKDHDLFLQSSTYELLLAFVFNLSDSVRDTSRSTVEKQPLVPEVERILGVLDSVEEVINKCPPEEQGGSRFGNPGFRVFLDALHDELQGWHRKLGIEDPAAIEEVSTYLLHSFGNRTRIDYGSGHELNFIVWQLCLYRVGLLPESTLPDLALRVFPRYLRLMRQIQTTYYLEPAGSHGVWGLDDYQFLPFLIGASQLLHHPYIRPMSIHQSIVIEEYGKDYLYLDQVGFVNSVKNVEGLRWHSPMLDDISAAKNWGKVEGGMRRMFVAEVLKKLPVMQHFMFGSLVPAVEGMSTEEELGMASEDSETECCEADVTQDGQHQHVHQQAGWGDCCGIKVPSSIGAAQEMKKRMGGTSLRRLPFD